jgi:hypothetical protein
MVNTFPTSPSPSSITIDSSIPTLQTRTISGKYAGQAVGVERLIISLNWPQRSYADYIQINGFFKQQRASGVAFYYVIPSSYGGSITGTQSGVFQVDGAAQTGRTIVCDGLDLSEVGALKQGDLITFTNHDKIYTITADVTSDGSGSATITIEPPIQSTISDNEDINVSGIKALVRFKDDSIQLMGRNGGIGQVSSFSMIEEL